MKLMSEVPFVPSHSWSTSSLNVNLTFLALLLYIPERGTFGSFSYDTKFVYVKACLNNKQSPYKNIVKCFRTSFDDVKKRMFDRVGCTLIQPCTSFI